MRSSSSCERTRRACTRSPRACWAPARTPPTRCRTRLVRAWLALAEVPRDGRFSTWLYRIVVNSAHDVRTNGATGSSRSHPTPSTRATGSPSRSLGELQRALNALDESYRVAVVLYDVLGCSYAEIAEMTGVPEGTVKSRIFRGRSELAERLGTHVEGAESNE